MDGVTHLSQRIADRASNESTAEKYGFSGCSEVGIQDSEVELERLTICKACKGKGTVKPMFYVMECPDCFGTTLDLSEPLAVIKLQQQFLTKAKAVIVAQRRALYENSLSEGEAMEETMDHFYKSAKRFD